jgi:hypothetical protein
METQVCNRCHQTKRIEEFSWRWKALGQRQRTCRACQSEQKKSWYERNKKSHKANVYENKTKNIEAGRTFVWEYLLSHPCAECGQSDPTVLEFDHVRGRKRAEVTKLVRDGYSLKIIQQEIDKCVVLCANCHKKKTYQNSWRDKQT